MVADGNTILGTGAGVPAKHRNVTGIALKLLDERNAVWLFDCGKDAIANFKSSIRPRKLKRFYYTFTWGSYLVYWFVKVVVLFRAGQNL